MKLLFLIPFLIALKINSQVLEFSLSKEGDNLSNLPFYVGIDAGSSVRLKEKENYCKLGFSIYMNINLYRRIVFLRSEVGNFDQTVYQYEGTTKTYFGSVWSLSLGLQFMIIKFGRNRINLGGNLQLLAYGKKGYPMLTLFGNTELIVPLSDFFALAGGFKMHYARSWNPFLTVGLQIGNFK